MALNINGTTGISGVDGSASAASIAGTDANTGLSFASDTVNINTGGVTRLSIPSDGKINFGSVARVEADGVFKAAHGSASTPAYNFLNDNDNGMFRATTNTIGFSTGGTERMRIDSSGNVGIGNSSPSTVPYGISLLPFVANDTSRISFNRSGNSYVQTVLEFQNGDSTVGTIKHNNSSTQYNTSSDYRLKENVVSISDGITRLKTLKPYRFNFKNNKDVTVDGFLAHEVTAVPEAISGTKDEMKSIYYKNEDTIPVGKKIGDFKEYSTTEPEYQGIDQSKLVPLLTAALQEAVAKIEVLETKVAALEAG